MSNKDKQRATKASASAAPATEAAKPVVQAAPQVLFVLKKDVKLRGARADWHARLVEHDGQPVDTYIQSCKDNPPHLPKSGRAENPTGWLSWFKREGIVEVKTGA